MRGAPRRLLALPGNGLGDTAAPKIKSLVQAGRPAHLDLSANHLTEEGTMLLPNTSLEMLGLQRNAIAPQKICAGDPEQAEW